MPRALDINVTVRVRHRDGWHATGRLPSPAQSLRLKFETSNFERPQALGLKLVLVRSLSLTERSLRLRPLPKRSASEQPLEHTLSNSGSNANFTAKIAAQTLRGPPKLESCLRGPLKGSSQTSKSMALEIGGGLWHATCACLTLTTRMPMAYRPAHHICLSKCVVQVMRVLSLPALLLPLAKLHIRYGITQPTAYRINFAPKLWWPLALYEDTMRVYLGAFPAAQVARRLRTRPPRHECPRFRRA